MLGLLYCNIVRIFGGYVATSSVLQLENAAVTLDDFFSDVLRVLWVLFIPGNPDKTVLVHECI